MPALGSGTERQPDRAAPMASAIGELGSPGQAATAHERRYEVSRFEYIAGSLGFGVRVGRIRIFYLWQKAEVVRAADLRAQSDGGAVLHHEYDPSGRRGCRARCRALLHQSMMRL